jgi:hypothetical protein
MIVVLQCVLFKHFWAQILLLTNIVSVFLLLKIFIFKLYLLADHVSSSVYQNQIFPSFIPLPSELSKLGSKWKVASCEESFQDFFPILDPYRRISFFLSLTCYIYSLFNPNPHGLKAITKTVAIG